MPIPYERYLNIKDKYCICYYGVFNEFVLQLLYLRPAIELELPGIELYISCKDELKLKTRERVVSQADFNKHDYAYVFNLKFNNISHPIEDMLNESAIQLKHLIPPISTAKNTHCVILTNGLGSFRSMTPDEINKAKQLAINKGFQVTLNQDVDNAGWVIGVECENFYRAATEGVKVTLVPTGLGTKFFQKAFPHGEILA